MKTTEAVGASKTARDDAIDAIALLDDRTRRALYDWVAAQPAPVSRDEAAVSLGMSRALAAFHLDRLVRGGLLDSEFQRRSGRSGPGAGRPAKLYRRSARELDIAMPARRYALAAELFATALEQGDGRASVSEVAHEAGMALGRQASQDRGKGDVVATLSAAGYEPVVTDDGTIRLRNCPFDALAQRHRSLTCGMNVAFAQGIVDGLADTSLSAQQNVEPGWCCVEFRRRTAS